MSGTLDPPDPGATAAPLRRAARRASAGGEADRRGLLFACVLLPPVVAALALIAFPLGFLDGTAPFWRYPRSDFAEHIIGGRYFLADIWRLPLLYVPTLGVPEGSNIGLTDSIPIAALLAKLLRGVTPAGTIYLPVWLTACYLLQGPAGAVALHALGVRRASLLFLGGLLCVFTPVLLARFYHAALCGQFLLLLGSALLFHASRPAGDHRARWWFVPLLLLALLVHIYLFAMVFALAVAALLQGLWADRLSVIGAFGWLFGYAACIAVVMALCGYFSLGPIPMKPYGETALNLAALVTPAPSAVFRQDGFAPAIGFESYAWPGAGVVLLLAATAVLWRATLRRLAQAYFPTLAIVATLLVLAASYAVRVGPVLVLGVDAATIRQAALGGGLAALRHALSWQDVARIGLWLLLLAAGFGLALRYVWRLRQYPLLRFVLLALAGLAVATALRPRAAMLALSNFQASARFVWVLLYLLVVLAIAGVCQRLPRRWAVTLLATALALQVFDTAPLWRVLQAKSVEQPAPPPDEVALVGAMRDAARVTLLPTYLCAFAEPLDTAAREALIDRVVDVAVLASRWALPINSVRHSRMTATDQAALAARCAAERQAVAPQRGTALFVLDGAPNEAALADTLASKSGCRRLTSGVLCRPDGG